MPDPEDRSAHGAQEPVDGAGADLRPCSIPFSTALRKWNPTRMRESPFSSAASEKLSYRRVTAEGSLHVLPEGSVRLQVLKVI